MKKKQFLVIGAGRFGISVARTLMELGHDVMLVDNDADLVQKYSSEFTDAIKGNAASEDCLHKLGVFDFDAVVLAIGFDVQASIMAAIILVEIGVERIVAKAQSSLHGRVLEKIGVHRVVFPERDMGQKLAHSLVTPSFVDMLELSDEYSVVEVSAPLWMVDKSLSELDLRARCGINVIAIRRSGNGNTILSPKAEDVILGKDILVITGSNQSLKKMEFI